MKPAEDAKVVLARMMKELAEHDWPTDETWAAACRVLGRAPPRKLRAGKPQNILTLPLGGLPKRRSKP